MHDDGLAQGLEDQLEFVPINPGSFQMGCTREEIAEAGDPAECPADETPAHEVGLTKAFEIGKYEVTQAQWKLVVGTEPSYFKGERRPVEQVSWDDVQVFLMKINARKDGYRYRLPTEAEWEYVLRAGSTRVFGELGLTASASFEIDGHAAVKPIPESAGAARDVGLKAPNVWGVYDMRGNVKEWVQDWYSEEFYRLSPGDDPRGPGEPPYHALGPYHVARGGSWREPAPYLRASDRYPTVAGLRRRDIGFRVVRERL